MKSQISKNYIYAIARRDIPIAQQAIQAGHAAIEYAYQHGRPSDHHPSLIYLTIRDKHDLEVLKRSLHEQGIKTSEFHEPYQDWGLTAIACQLDDSNRSLLKHLRLWRTQS